ncbi:MAG TPA: glycoside hydrolase family 31 protein [Candidatus Brocadiia bacterium]|nr:glycoside hydrolase family 31 protein [Candidatus Brocadiia bacterium]
MRIRSLVLLLLFAAVTMFNAASGWELNSTPDNSRQALTPEWAFGLWWWEDDVNKEEVIWDFVNGCEKHDLPIACIMIDSPWSTLYNNFDWDTNRYPEPKQMIDELHARNIRVVLWMTCILNHKDFQADACGTDKEDVYKEALEKGYLANDGKLMKWWKGKGGFIDYTNPEAVEWWHRLLDRVLDMGVDGWKCDGAAELFYPPFGAKCKKGHVGTMDYVDYYYGDCYEYLLTKNPQGATLVRSIDGLEYNMSGRHAMRKHAPVTWVGDQRHWWTDKGMDIAIAQCFTAMKCGYSVIGSDNAGYQSWGKSNLIDRTLFLRWSQWSAFMPLFLSGGHNEHRPWMYDSEVFEIFRRYAWMHDEMRPFYYSLVRTAHNGGPCLFTVLPGEYTYGMGGQFLVAPIHEPKPKRTVEFPEGDWLYYWDNDVRYSGPQKVELTPPLKDMPVFVRSGSIIPLKVEREYAGHGYRSSAGWTTLDVYPDASRKAEFKLWAATTEDNATDLACEMTETGNLTLNISGGVERGYILRARYPFKPGEVAVARGNEKEILPWVSYEAWHTAEKGWHYAEGDKRLWVRVPKNAGCSVVVTSKSPDADDAKGKQK